MSMWAEGRWGRGWLQLWREWSRAEASELKAEVVNVRGRNCGDNNNNNAQSRSDLVIHVEELDEESELGCRLIGVLVSDKRWSVFRIMPKDKKR